MESIHQTQKNKCSGGEHIIMGKEEVAVYRAHTGKEKKRKKPCAFDQRREKETGEFELNRPSSWRAKKRREKKSEGALLSQYHLGVSHFHHCQLFLSVGPCLPVVWGCTPKQSYKN